LGIGVTNTGGAQWDGTVRKVEIYPTEGE
jgi:hypothetical protein